MILSLPLNTSGWTPCLSFTLSYREGDVVIGGLFVLGLGFVVTCHYSVHYYGAN